eukprot:CAMPEP_0195266164 /NCGR_PEP_ID=MMETSP0706-20130129/11847_1 /TAXON_ID=33640 /ORGANISM="Asterionellopsis glacialis, Strain CCMP134" /LENGTH=116 /DNA_ID=CAMNT_0040320703 /DNA_START=95 /DNA_END=446 /DNA_ORIENTATION=-
MTRVTLPVYCMAVSAATVSAFTPSTAGRRGFAQVSTLAGSSATARSMITTNTTEPGVSVDLVLLTAQLANADFAVPTLLTVHADVAFQTTASIASVPSVALPLMVPLASVPSAAKQ